MSVTEKLVKNEKKDWIMRMKLRYVTYLGVVAIAISLCVGTLFATPATSGFHSASLAMAGGVTDIDAFTQHVLSQSPEIFPINSPLPEPGKDNVWLSMQKTKGKSDVYIQSNSWDPQAHTGWHTHPGHSIIIVKTGTLVVYDGNCQTQTYGPGDAIIDVGGDHIHLIQNPSIDKPATTYAVQIIPEGAVRRVDVKLEDAPSCPIQ